MLRELFGDHLCHVLEWHKRFSEGSEGVEDDERPSRPVTSRRTKGKVQNIEFVRKDLHLGIWMIADIANTNKIQ